VNFTREPIIETVITPREGCKLVVRSSKGANQEDYFVDAVEVVSFGRSFFFRSLERPKSFLVPVSDYEILELKETRMVLKNATAERSIKIGGGREAPMRSREPAPEMREEGQSAERGQQQQPSDRMDRKRDKRRRRRGRDRDRQEQSQPQEEIQSGAPASEEEAPFEAAETGPQELFSEREPFSSEESKAAPSFISKLFPPPPTLIKDTLSRYKTAETEGEDLFPPSSEEPVAFEEKTAFEESIFEHRETPPESEMEDSEE
jgi:hypothetical protein